MVSVEFRCHLTILSTILHWYESPLSLPSCISREPLSPLQLSPPPDVDIRHNSPHRVKTVKAGGCRHGLVCFLTLNKVPRINVTKYRLTHTLLFVLIVAFLTMQSAAAHIHLAEHHDHDGSHHQHQSATHAHQSIDSHADAINSSHQMDHVNVVELDHECSTTTKNKQEKPSASIVTRAFRQPILSKSISIELPVVINTKLNYLYYSTINPRAPPYFS